MHETRRPRSLTRIMHIPYKDFRTRVLLALLAISVLISAGVYVLDAIKAEYRRNIEDHVISNLETMSRGLVLLQQDSVARARKIADEPLQKEFAARLLKTPDDPSLHDAYENWITPLYQSRGFEDYTLIAPDGKRVITSGTRPYIGQLTLPATRETLRRSELLMGGAVTPPISARHPVSTLWVENPSAIAYQLSCARAEQDGRLIGFLCLHENPALRLYRLLRDGRPGVHGEAYVVDQDGQILSPIRFEKKLAAPKGAEPGWSLFQLSARVLPIREEDGLADPALLSTEPFTRVFERLMEYTSLDTGLLENYPDYRGRMVVGAGRWMQDAAIGLIVEEDMDEAFRSYYFARNALVALISLGSMLIVLLTYADWRSRRSLARSEQRLAAFRDYIPAGMNMKSADGRYLMANPVFESIAEMPPGYVLGKTDAEIYPVEEARMRQREHDEVLRTGRPFTRNYTKHNAQGKEETYSIVRFPVRGDKDGSVVAVGTVALDITELISTQRDLEELTQTLENKVAERTEELAAARDLAETASRAKAEFLANMSHEIRTPLNAIIGMGHLAAHANTDPRVAHYIGRIQSSGQHLLGIVNDILDLSKIEAGKLQIDVSEFSLEALLDHVAGLVAEQAQAKDLELIIAIAPGLPDQLVGDAKRIGQILINFANNAVKFTEHGEIVLRVQDLASSSGRAHLRFEVEDTGIGIAEEKLPLLFRPFQQLDGSMSRQFEGSGLGLAISRSLADLMDARIDVQSQPGQGSVFSLEITLRVSHLDNPGRQIPAGLSRLRALVVDDNTHARQQLQGQLHALEVQVDEADDGNRAIELIAEADQTDHPYDVVFLDWQMPGLNGLETAEQMLQHPLQRKQPHLVLVASAGQDSPPGLDRLPIDSVLAKPVTPSELYDAMVELFDPTHVPKAQDTHGLADWEGLAGRRILLVEDNRINQEVVHDLLEMVGVHVTIGSDGLQGIQLLNGQPFDLVLMDIHMPNMDGFEATAEIRKNPAFAQIPIIALTANALEGDLERCLAAGMNDYIAKPIHPQQMFATLSRHLAMRPRTQTVTAAAGGQTNPSATDKNERLLTSLADIPGINITQAITRMLGRRDLYAQLACRIAAERGGMVDALDAAIREQDDKAMLDLVHNAKSMLGMLGADTLQQQCIDLQQQLADGAVNAAEIAAFARDLATLLQRLGEATRAHDTSPTG